MRLKRFLFWVASLLLLLVCSVTVSGQYRPFRPTVQFAAGTTVGTFFGDQITVVGDYVAVAAREDDTHAENSGAVHIFDQFDDGPIRVYEGAVYEYDYDGNLVSQIDHPGPDADRLNCFGLSGAFVESDRIVIGDGCRNGPQDLDEAGAAFLFSLNGELLQTFDNPEPATLDGFGGAVAYAGERILIGGAQIDDLQTGASTGAAYIFETDGTLVTRVSDPEPGGGNWFAWNAGSMMLESGEEVFLIGSIFNSTAFRLAGKVFVSNVNGEIIQTLESPMAGPGGQFGASFEQFGDKLLVGALHDGGGYPNGTGAVWLFEQADLGDFDLNGKVDELDLNILCSDLVSGELTESWDITGDSTIDRQDLTRFLMLTKFVPGDADVDGEVTFADFLDLSSSFGNPGLTAWSDGNFNCSGNVDFEDFLLLSGNYVKSATALVPEPNSSHWIVLIVCGLLWRFCTNCKSDFAAIHT